MAAIMGRQGLFSATTSTAASSVAMGFIDSWTLNPSVSLAEVTAFGDSWESYEPTIKGWTGTASGTLDRSVAQQAQLLDQLEDATFKNVYARFYISQSTSGDKRWSGQAIVESWSVDSKVKDKVSLTFNLRGDGALAYSTTAS